MKSDKIRSEFFDALLEDALLAYEAGDHVTSASLLKDAKGLYPVPSRRYRTDDLGSWFDACINFVKYGADEIQWRKWHAQPKHEVTMLAAFTKSAESMEEDKRILQSVFGIPTRPSMHEIGRKLFPVQPLPDGAKPIYLTGDGSE